MIFLLLGSCDMFFYCFFCAFFAGVSWAVGVDDFSEKVYLNFHNNTADDVSIRIEKSCSPTFSIRDKSSLLLKKNSELRVEYDLSVTNCLLVASLDKEFGSDLSLFVLDAILENIDFNLGFSDKPCDVDVSLIEQSYHLRSDCIAIKKI